MPRDCSVSSRHTRTAPLFSPAGAFVCFRDPHALQMQAWERKKEGFSAHSGKHAHWLSAHTMLHVRSQNEQTQKPRLSWLDTARKCARRRTGPSRSNSATLFSCSQQTARLPDLLWLTRAPGSDNLSQRGMTFAAERGQRTTPFHSTTAPRRCLVRRGGRGEKHLNERRFADDSPRTFGSRRVSTKVPCQPIKDVKLASWAY